jgi:hypothetical protein
MNTTPLSKRLLYSAPVQKALTWLVRVIIKSLSWTLRYEIEGIEEVQTFLRDPNHPPCILAMWHNRQLLTYPLYRKAFGFTPAAILISKSRDGDIPTDYALSYSNSMVIRVGHKARHEALLRMIDAIEKKWVCIITPDGPRGPIYAIKPGILFLAKKSHAVIIALSWTASTKYEFSSWDRFQLPLPFAKIRARFSEPISLPENGDEKELAERLKAALG